VTTRVLLADDHLLVRAGIRALLGALPDVEVVGEAATGEEAVVLAQELKPDIALLDISMQGMNGLEAARRIGEFAVGVRVIML
jgi:DNA-binding NarL/FixJ family response regulator